MGTGIVVVAISLLTILFVAFVVTLVALWKRTSTKAAAPPSSPLDHAKLRLAKGEISHEEFERIKKDLS